MNTEDQLRLPESLKPLYERYVKPLEAEHFGQFVAVLPDGRVMLGDSALDVAQRAHEAGWRGCTLFKIGPGAVGKLL
jgi:hypothetical protein